MEAAQRPDSVSLVRLDLPADRVDLTELLTHSTFAFHAGPRHTEESVHRAIDAGRFQDGDHDTFWIVDDAGQRAGIFRFEDLGDDTPMFDLRLAEAHRGRGLGRRALRSATDWLFSHHPHVHRFEGNTRVDNVAMRRAFEACGWVKEGHYRQAWPTEDGGRVDGVAYAVLRQDWESGDTTLVRWDDLASRS